MPFGINYKKLQEDNLARTQGYLSVLKRLYNKAISKFISLSTDVDYDQKGQFYFDDYPELKTTVAKTVKDLALGIQQTILRGTTVEWAKGTDSTKGIVDYVLKSVGVKSVDDLDDKVIGKYLNNHDKALAAFQKRSINGLSLSDKVWNLANHQKIEAELARSIAEGTSADDVARSMQEWLKEPDKLFRRVRDEYGTLRLSKNAKAYTPDAGSYRSSFKNAQRLARTEINMAYRNAELESYQDKDYVVGFEIHRSTNPYPCPLCDALTGRYPKDFVWNGWHPNCRCYMIPVLITREEMAERRKAIINGEGFDATKSDNYVDDVPEGFKKWVYTNTGRIEAAQERGTAPYFIRDNKEVVSEYLNKSAIDDAQSKHVTAEGKDMLDDIVELYDKQSIKIDREISERQIQNQHYIAEMQGFTGKPIIVDKFEDGDIKVFRGVAAFHDKAEEYAEQFRTGEMFSGGGFYGNGTYSSNDIDVAKLYAGQHGAILEMALPKNMKIIDFDDIDEEYGIFASEHLLDSVTNFIDEIGAFATAKGYDAIRVVDAGGYKRDYYVIFNRTKVKCLRKK